MELDLILLYSYNSFYNYWRQVILLKKTTAAQNEDALGYHRVRGLYFQAVVFVATIVTFIKFTIIFLVLFQKQI